MGKIHAQFSCGRQIPAKMYAICSRLRKRIIVITVIRCRSVSVFSRRSCNHVCRIAIPIYIVSGLQMRAIIVGISVSNIIVVVIRPLAGTRNGIHQCQRFTAAVIVRVHVEDHADGGEGVRSGSCQESVRTEHQGVVNVRCRSGLQTQHIAHGRQHRTVHIDDKIDGAAFANRGVGFARVQYGDIRSVNATGMTNIIVFAFHGCGFGVGDTLPFERIQHEAVSLLNRHAFRNLHLYLRSGTMVTSIRYCNGYAVCARDYVANICARIEYACRQVFCPCAIT